MTIEQKLQQEIEESKRWLNLDKVESNYKRDLAIRIELINWLLDNIKNPHIQICDLIKSNMKEIILKINQPYTISESDKLDSELRLMEWIFYQVCSNEIKKV